MIQFFKFLHNKLLTTFSDTESRKRVVENHSQIWNRDKKGNSVVLTFLGIQILLINSVVLTGNWNKLVGQLTPMETKISI